MSQDFDQLEMQLRVLGRQLGAEAPGPELMQRVQRNSRAPLSAQAVLVRRQRMFTLYMLLLVTFPVPLLFVWFDWSAINSMFVSLLPPAASSFLAGFFLWLKLAALVLIYGIGLGGIAWMMFASRQNEGRFVVAGELLES